MEVILLIVGLLVGALLGWLWANRKLFGSFQEERERRVAAETRLAEIEKQREAERSLVEDAKAQLGDTFKALSSDALRSNSQAFVESAKQTLEPVREALRRYEDHLREIEGQRQRAYGSLDEQLKSLLASEQQLQRETGNLVNALRRPQVRGRWGELTLRRAVELAGMTEHVDYSEQVTVESDDGRLRPDMVVHLPAGRQVVVDSKVSLDAYLNAMEAPDEEKRAAHLTDHCRQMRDHIRALSAKSYWQQFEPTPEFVVMFVPGESFLYAACAVAKSAQEVSELGRDLYDRIRTFVGHLADVGKNLDRASDAFNRSVGSLESRILPSARRFRELGAATGDEIPELEPIDTRSRRLTAPEASDHQEDPPL